MDDPKKRFRLCVRCKRGMTDTSFHGGYYKDKVYFEGAVKILTCRKTIDFDDLYAGKISVDDIKKKQLAKYLFSYMI